MRAIKISDNVAHRRGRARGAVHRRPARARAPDDRDGALPAQRADVASTPPTPASRPREHRARSGSSPNMNPDGSEYDIATGSYRSWRKNRQPNAGSTAVGTDLNRNWGFNWGCCGGSSGTFSLGDLPRRRRAFSAPETQRVRDFVNSRVVGGVQQIKADIDFHTYSELVLWPYGYTTANTAPDARRRRPQATFATLGRNMAATNGYTPEQASRPLHHRRLDRRLAVGRAQDLRLHVRDVPAHARTRLLPARRGDRPQTTRNREAVLLLLEYSDCPYARHRQAGAVLRRPGARRPVYSDDFEAAQRLDAFGRHGDDRALRARRPGRDDLQRRQAARHDDERLQRPRHRAPRGRRRRRERHRRRHTSRDLAGDRAARRRHARR